jgi:SAM-dependent methyltransferase
MKIHTEELSDVTRYIANNQHLRIEDHEEQFKNYLRLITPHHQVDASTRMLEVGTGTGWFPLMCKMKGLDCRGLEISTQLVEYAKKFGRQYGIESDIQLGNVEEQDIGNSEFDVIIAFSVFEHVQHWRLGLERIYKALKPGGVLLFGSTNKFGPSNEFDFPFYGWIPDNLRYRLRIHYQGPEIMKLGIDFNQFTYPQLRRTFREIGFQRVYDRMQIADPSYRSSGLRRMTMVAAKRVPLVRHLVLTFIEGTDFICMK